MVLLLSEYLETWIAEKKDTETLLFEHLPYEEAYEWLCRYFCNNVPEDRAVAWMSGETFDDSRYYVPLADWAYKN